MSKGCKSDSLRDVFVFATSKNAVSLWNVISYSLSSSDRCGWCHCNSSVDWLVLSEISSRQQFCAVYLCACLPTTGLPTERTFIHNYWENWSRACLQKVLHFSDLHTIPIWLFSKSIWNCKYLYLIYCVQDIEISVKHCLLLLSLFTVTRSFGKVHFNHIGSNEHLRKTDAQQKYTLNYLLAPHSFVAFRLSLHKVPEHTWSSLHATAASHAWSLRDLVQILKRIRAWK